jgi:hypothetical protein
MVQQRIPSVIIKLFRSFIDLSPSYYNSSSNTDVSSISATGNIIVDILKQFVKNQFVLHRLMTEDTLFMMIRIMTAKPTILLIPEEDHDTEPAYMIWKVKTVEILKTLEMNGEVCQYLHQRRSLEVLVRTWKEAVSKDNLTFVDYRELILALDLIYHQLRGASKIQFHGLSEEMIQESAYDIMYQVLKTAPFDTPLLELKVCDANLAFIKLITCCRWKS